MTDQVALVPVVNWAQRSSVIFLTINLGDVENPDIKLCKDSVYFKGIGGVEKKLYEVTIPLYKEIDAEKSNYFIRGRLIEFLLAKANTGESYWPKLTSGKEKYHWIKCDFDKWLDEEDEEGGDEGVGGMGMGGDNNFEEMMRQMGGLGGAGAGKPSFEGVDEPGLETDSDDEPIPDLE